MSILQSSPNLGRRAGTLLAVALLVAACSSSSSSPTTPVTPPTSVTATGSVVLSPRTRVLDAKALAALTSWSADKTTLTFTSGNAVVDALAAGDIIAGGISALTPTGLLRTVSSVRTSGSSIIVATSGATLTDAIKSGSAHFTGPVTKGPVASGAPAAGAHTLVRTSLLHTDTPLVGGTAYDLSYGFSEALTQDDMGHAVTLSGTVGVSAGFDIDLGFNTSGLQATFAIDGSEGGTLDLVADAGFTVSKETTIVPLVFTPIVVLIPPIDFPIVIVPELDVKVGAEATLASAVELGATETGTLKLGLGIVDGKPGVIDSGSVSGSVDKPTLPTAVYAKAQVGLSFGLAFYGLVGPAIEGDAFAELGIDSTGKDCWEADCGLEVSVGLGAGAFSSLTSSFQTGAVVAQKTLARGACSRSAQSPTFAETLGGAGKAVALALAADGGSYVATNVSGQGQGAVLAHVRTDGTLDWSSHLQGLFASGLVTTPDGFAVAGIDGNAAWLAGLDPTGAVQWSRKLSPAGAALGVSAVAQTSDGGFVLTGQTLDAKTELEAWVGKVDARGNVLWWNTYGVATPHAVAATADGGALVVGERSETPNTGGYALRLGADGSVTWVRIEGYGRLFAVAPTVAGKGFVVGGSTQEGAGWVAVLGDDGTVVWSRGYTSNDAADPKATSVTHVIASVADTGDGVAVTGSDQGGSLWVMKVAANQSVEWARALGGVSTGGGETLVTRPDGSLFVFGDSGSLSGPSSPSEPWLLGLPHDALVTFAGTSGAAAFDETGAFPSQSGAGVAAGSASVAPLAVMAADDPLSPSRFSSTVVRQTQ